MLWSVKDILWGVDNVFYRQGHADGILQNFMYQLVYDATRFHLIFYTHVICALLSLIENRWSFLPRIITWLTGLMLYYSAVEAFNSGMLLMLLMAAYCSVVHTTTNNIYRIVLTNAARIACIAQVVMVYAVATIYKLSGTQWISGEAMYYTQHIAYLSAEWWRNSALLTSPALLRWLTWLALAYQLLFPIIIWIKKIKPIFLFVGICFHLFIGIMMHLWDFALAMIFCYALFAEENFAKLLLPRFRYFSPERSKKPV